MHAYIHVCVLSHFSHVRLFETLWTVVHQAPLSIGILQAKILEWVVMPFSRDSRLLYSSKNSSKLLIHATYWIINTFYWVTERKPKRQRSTWFHLSVTLEKADVVAQVGAGEKGVCTRKSGGNCAGGYMILCICQRTTFTIAFGINVVCICLHVHLPNRTVGAF